MRLILIDNNSGCVFGEYRSDRRPGDDEALD
jgi:hypothetical protein